MAGPKEHKIFLLRSANEKNCPPLTFFKQFSKKLMEPLGYEEPELIDTGLTVKLMFLITYRYLM